MLKRDGRVYTQMVKNCSANELIPILSQFSELDESVIYSDCWKAYDGLVDYGAKAHYRVKHSKNEFVNGKNHINGIENFWGYAKHRLSKFKGIKKENFLLHLKECEFRYNNSKDTKTFYHILLKMIRGLISSKTKSQLKIHLSSVEPFLNIRDTTLTIFLAVDSIFTIYFWLMLDASYYLLGKDTQSKFFYPCAGLAFMCIALQFIDISPLNGSATPYALLTIALLIPICELAAWVKIKNIALAQP